MKEEEEFINPIDKDKITENPHTLPYAHTIGGAQIKPIDKGRTKGLALEAMHSQTHMQMDQIKKQMELLAEQAKMIQKRVELSEIIYNADMNFKPLINHIYHLYQKKDGTALLSLVAHDEWGPRGYPFDRFLATVKLLADHTWDILFEGEDEDLSESINI